MTLPILRYDLFSVCCAGVWLSGALISLLRSGVPFHSLSLFCRVLFLALRMLHHARSRELRNVGLYLLQYTYFGESGLLENEPTAPAEQAHTTRRQ